jgi:hypothetical protein
VSLDGLVQKVHHFISGSLMENFLKLIVNKSSQ